MDTEFILGGLTWINAVSATLVTFGLGLILRVGFFRRLTARNNRVQDVHELSTSRFGGAAVVISSVIGLGCLLSIFSFELVTMFILSLGAFFVGLWDDLAGHLSPRIRIFLVVSLSIISGLQLGWVSRIDSAEIFFANDWPLEIFIALTIISIVGLTNAFNFIDGLHGLASGVFLSIMAGFYYLAVSNGIVGLDTFISIIFFSSLGIFVLIFPRGAIFLGDCGAYFMGFLVAQLAIYINNATYQISSWCFFLMCIYPITDLSLAVYRRIFIVGQFFQADGQHLHHLVHSFVRERFPANDKVRKTWTTNAIASLICLALSCLPVIIAVKNCQSPKYLQVACLAFFLGYTLIYRILLRRQLSDVQ